jgi:amylosucrase
MVGYVFYADRFAGRLADIPDRLPYLADLGVSYVHIMPCLKPRPEPSDGGYAVQDYRAVNPALGTMDDLESLARAMREGGMSLCIDLVLNHTAKEHAWAEAARAGDPFFRAFYRFFDDDTLPRLYERTLVEVFPDQAPGNFTWYPDIRQWVWTTFNEYQWDLNWENPEVLLATLDTILFLANKGVEVFRLDAVAFMWKRMGTGCQNLPEVHDLLQAIAQATRIAAPAVIHKAEAIVGPTDLVPYLGTGRHAGRESNLAYHNNLMVQFWASLASGDTRLMTHVLRTHFPEGFRRATWATYIRCHDDIGWAITDEDAAAVGGMTGAGHRRFLAEFYTGRFPGSFARGGDFQVNEATGDRRTNGSFASLAGLQAALEGHDVAGVDLAVNRILLGHALIASFGGMPLIYMGDEIGLLNDPSYLDDPRLADDGRWMQRPRMDWETVATVAQGRPCPATWIHAGTRHILARRRATPELAASVPTRIRDTGHPGIFAFDRPADERTLTAVFNFTPEHRNVPLRALDVDPDRVWLDALSDRVVAFHGATLHLPPYGRVWLVPV